MLLSRNSRPLQPSLLATRSLPSLPVQATQAKSSTSKEAPRTTIRLPVASGTLVLKAPGSLKFLSSEKPSDMVIVMVVHTSAVTRDTGLPRQSQRTLRPLHPISQHSIYSPKHNPDFYVALHTHAQLTKDVALVTHILHNKPNSIDYTRAS